MISNPIKGDGAAHRPRSWLYANPCHGGTLSSRDPWWVIQKKMMATLINPGTGHTWIPAMGVAWLQGIYDGIKTEPAWMSVRGLKTANLPTDTDLGRVNGEWGECRLVSVCLLLLASRYYAFFSSGPTVCRSEIGSINLQELSASVHLKIS